MPPYTASRKQSWLDRERRQGLRTFTSTALNRSATSLLDLTLMQRVEMGRPVCSQRGDSYVANGG